MFSLSLICGNVAYLYLSVSFIQMLKATNVVVTLFATWAFGIAPLNVKTLSNVGIIVFGVIIASFGEIKFDLIGFLCTCPPILPSRISDHSQLTSNLDQCSGIVFEALRLVMIQRMLSSAEFKMDPLVSLYYYAPACAVINGVVTMVVEIPRMTMGDIYSVGIFTLLANAFVAFLLNVSVVFLVCPAQCLSCLLRSRPLTCLPTDWKDFCRCTHHVRYPQGHSPRLRLSHHFP